MAEKSIILNWDQFKVSEEPGPTFWRSYMPSTDLAAIIGATVTWDAASSCCIWDGKYKIPPYKLDDPVPGRSTSLIRIVCEALGWQVTWLEYTKQIRLYKNVPDPPIVNPPTNPGGAGNNNYYNNNNQDNNNNDNLGTYNPLSAGVYTGADAEIKILLPGEKPVVLGETSTLSYSVLRDAQELRTLGRITVKGITKGGRRVAGSLILTVFDRHAILSMRKVLKSLQSTGPIAKNDMYERMRTDELPPFDVILTLANEYGNSSYMVIYGVTVFSDGKVISVEDAYSENIWEFIARDIQLLRPGGPVTNMPNEEFFSGMLAGGSGFNVGNPTTGDNGGSNGGDTNKPTGSPLNMFRIEVKDSSGNGIPDINVRVNSPSFNSALTGTGGTYVEAKTGPVGACAFGFGEGSQPCNVPVNDAELWVWKDGSYQNGFHMNFSIEVDGQTIPVTYTLPGQTSIKVTSPSPALEKEAWGKGDLKVTAVCREGSSPIPNQLVHCRWIFIDNGIEDPGAYDFLNKIVTVEKTTDTSGQVSFDLANDDSTLSSVSLLPAGLDIRGRLFMGENPNLCDLFSFCCK